MHLCYKINKEIHQIIKKWINKAKSFVVDFLKILINTRTAQSSIDYFFETLKLALIHFISIDQQNLLASCKRSRKSCAVIICHAIVRSHGRSHAWDQWTHWAVKALNENVLVIYLWTLNLFVININNKNCDMFP